MRPNADLHYTSSAGFGTTDIVHGYSIVLFYLSVLPSGVVRHRLYVGPTISRILTCRVVLETNPKIITTTRLFLRSPRRHQRELATRAQEQKPALHLAISPRYFSTAHGMSDAEIKVAPQGAGHTGRATARNSQRIRPATSLPAERDIGEPDNHKLRMT